MSLYKKHFIVPVRFRPFHLGHKSLLENLLQEGSVTVVLCWSNILSTQSPIFTFESRDMVYDSMSSSINRITIKSMPLYEDEFLYASHLSKFIVDDRENIFVTGNPIARSAIDKHIGGTVLDPFILLDDSYKHISGTIVRQKMIDGDIGYEDMITDSVKKIILNNNIIERMIFIKNNSINMKLTRSNVYFCISNTNEELMYNEDEFMTDTVNQYRLKNTAEIQKPSILPIYLKKTLIEPDKVHLFFEL